jgi:hypothetical protein
MLPSGEALVAGGFFWWCSVAVPLVAHAENLSRHAEGHITLLLRFQKTLLMFKTGG